MLALSKLPVMTIRTRLTLWYSSLLATLIVVFGLSMFSLLNWAWRSQVQDNMRFIAKLTSANITMDGSGQLAASIPDTLELFPYYPFGVQVRQLNGTLVVASAYPRQYTAPFDPSALANLESDSVTREVTVGSTHALVLTAPITLRNGTVVGTIQIMSALSTFDAATERLFKVMIGVGLVALLLSFMVGTVIAGQGLQPIDAISQAAQQITAAGDLSKRIPYDGPSDELGQLTAEFNATLERLEKLFTAQRRFVADVSHELRTPLTTIQGNLDLIKRVGMDPMSLEAMDSEVKRMTRLVGDLLLLAQADSGRLPLIETQVELGSLALDVLRQAQVLADKVELKLGTVEAVHVKGDSDRLKQLLFNLITNAIKYTPEGGRVTVSVEQRGPYALLKVQDTGIGIPKEDLDHIFDRFYRVDKARSRQMGGTGLGLSIAQWIAEAHHGKIWAESEVGKGSTFYVQLPCIDPAPVSDSSSIKDTRPRIPLLRRPRQLNNITPKSIPVSAADKLRSNGYDKGPLHGAGTPYPDYDDDVGAGAAK